MPTFTPCPVSPAACQAAAFVFCSSSPTTAPEAMSGRRIRRGSRLRQHVRRQRRPQEPHALRLLQLGQPVERQLGEGLPFADRALHLTTESLTRVATASCPSWCRISTLTRLPATSTPRGAGSPCRSRSTVWRSSLLASRRPCSRRSGFPAEPASLRLRGAGPAGACTANASMPIAASKAIRDDGRIGKGGHDRGAPPSEPSDDHPKVGIKILASAMKIA